MDAIGFALICVGGYLMYAAYKNESPFQAFQSKLGTKTTPNPANPAAPINANGGTGTVPYGPQVP